MVSVKALHEEIVHRPVFNNLLWVIYCQHLVLHAMLKHFGVVWLGVVKA